MKLAKNNIHTVLLFIIPAFYVINGIIQYNFKNLKFIDTVDPEYAYIFNSFILAQFKSWLGHIDHPGTPVQILLAITFKIFYFLCNTELDFTHHFVQNTEIYMFYGHLSLLIFNGIILFITGFLIYRMFNKIIFGLFIQFTPFVDTMAFSISARIMPEILSVCSLLMVILLFKYMLDHKRNEKFYYTWLFAVTCGFLFSIKLTYLPFFLIPFILLKGYKKKLLFIFGSIGATCFFAFPVIVRYNHFKRWVIKLISHEGIYGSGQEGFINQVMIIPRLNAFIKNYPLFFISLILLLLISIIEIVRNYKQSNPIDIKIKILSTVFFALIIQVFISIKHFGYHYILPSSHFTLFIILTITLILIEWKTYKINYIYPIVFGSLSIIFIFNMIDYYKHANKIKFQHKLETFIKVKESRKQDYINIIIPDYYGSPFIEYALFFGAVSAGKHNHKCCNAIKEEFPKSYIFLPHVKTLYSSCYETSFKNLPDNNKVLIYSNKELPDVLSLILDSLNVQDHSNLKEFYVNEKTGEKMYLLNILLK